MRETRKKRKERCKERFCKKYTRKVMNIVIPGKKMIKGNEKMNKRLVKKMEKGTMEACKLYMCNEGCKGTIFEKGKKFPKLNKIITDSMFYDEKKIKEFRKKIFNKKTDVLIDNVNESIPLEINEKCKKNGAISICESHIPDSYLDKINESCSMSK
jgi:hypothetical protein